MPKPTLTGLQAAVGLTAGMISIVGAAYSAVQIFKPPSEHGEIVAIVREGRSERPIPDATLEVFTPHEALVTTLTASNKGQFRHTLKQGPYRLRVSHPRFGAEVRQVVVQPGRTAEVRFQLVQRVGGSSPLGEAARAVSDGVGSVQRFIRGLGL